MKQQSSIREPRGPLKQGSVHVDFPETDTEGTELVKTMASELQKLGNQDGLAESMEDLKINNHH